MRCYIDMDGVLADFYGGVCRAFGLVAWPYRPRRGEWDFFHDLGIERREIAAAMTPGFYASLATLQDGKALLGAACAAFGRDNVWILTAPWRTPGAHDGKGEWLDRCLPGWRERTIFAERKEAVAAPGTVLFDDSDANCEAFRKAGGKAVLLPRPWNARHGEALDGDRNLVPFDATSMVKGVK